MNPTRIIDGKRYTVYRIRNYLGEDFIVVTNVTPEQMATMGAPEQANTYLNCQGKIYRYVNGKWSDFYPFGSGAPGVDGASAYQIALNRGFVGTQDQWLASLKGVPGTSIKGDPGPANALAIGSVQTLPTGVAATASISGTPPVQTLDLGLPRGAPGDTGPANALTISSVSTLPAGSNATAIIRGTPPSQTLELGIPAGPVGPAGVSTLKIGTVSTLAAGSSATATITGTAPNQALNLGIPAGQKGDSGDAGTATAITMGSITTLPAGASATASIVDNKLNLGIPAGVAGPSSSIALGTVTTLAPGTAATASIAGGSLNLGIPGSKRIETYSANTDTNGLFTVTYPTPFSTTPNVHPEAPLNANQTWVKVMSTPTGFSYRLVQRAAVGNGLGVEILAATTTNVAGAPGRATVIATS